MVLENKHILIISPESYGDVFLSKHHYACELAKNNKVWYLNAKDNRNQKKKIETNRINENLIVINYYNLFYGFGKLPFFITQLINKYLSKKISRLIGNIDIVWSFEQAKFFNLKLFNARYAIFHPVDFIPFLEQYKLKIAQTSDVIFSVSDEILNEIKVNKPKHTINHGLSENSSNEIATLPFPLNRQKINIGYVGNVNIPYLDINNVKSAIEQNVACDFHFIGPYSASNLGISMNMNNYFVLKPLKNVFFQGIIEQSKLLNTLKEFDVFFVCYDYQNHPIRLSNSHKLLEYLSTGKAIISNYFPIYEKFDTDMILMLKNNHELGNTISNVVQNITHYNSEELADKRRTFASSNSYSNHLKTIEQILSNL